MAPGPIKPAEDDRLLDEVIAAYLEAEEAGRAPDPQELLDRHPELAPQLMQFFTNQKHFDRLAAPLRSVVPVALGATPFPADTPFPEAPAAAEAGPVPDSATRCLGDYELLEEIGRGGMGVVFKARQRSLNRLVALKVIRPDRLASAADVRRFQYEAELVAQLDHPHIVPVYEVNEWREGMAGPAQHYFSMKLMDGGSLAQALGKSSSAFSPKEAARLVAAVARAVHHAHQRGIFHRDLKPSNILLDAVGQPHVTDFGLAKRQTLALPASPTPAAVEPGGPPEELAPLPAEGQGEQADQAAERKAAPAESAFTFVGEIVGTPSYMAPEQTLGKKGTTSTQTDVHGLGAILYTLLTGRPPFQGASSYEILVEVQTRVPDSPRKSNARVDRDLEAICLKCLAKEPGQRYGSAEALAIDLERCLNGEPVQAHPISRPERVWRWCRRKPLAAAGTVGMALAVMALVVSTALIWEGQQEAKRQGQRADRILRLARAREQGLTEKARGLASRPHMMEARRVLLEEAVRSYDVFLQEDSTDPEVRRETGSVYLRMGELQNELGQLDAAEESYRRAQDIFEPLAAEHPSQPDYRRDLARSYEGPDWNALDKPEEVAPAIRKALAIRQQLVEEHPDNAEYRHELAFTYCKLANAFPQSETPAERLEANRKALDVQEALVKERPEVLAYRLLLSRLLSQRGCLLRESGKYAEAMPFLDRALTIAKELAEKSPGEREYRVEVGTAYFFLAQLLDSSGQFAGAEEAARQALDQFKELTADFPSDPAFRAWRPQILCFLGQVLVKGPRSQEAESAYREALAHYSDLERDYPVRLWNRLARINLSLTCACLGEFLMHTARLEEAEQAFSEQVRLCREAAKDYPKVALIRNNLANGYSSLGFVLKSAGQLQEAAANLLQALDVQQSLIKDGPDDRLHRENLSEIHVRLAVVQWLYGQRSQAEENHRQAVALLEQLVAERREDTSSRIMLAWYLATCPAPHLRDPNRALSLTKEILGMMPQDGFSWGVQGVAHFRAENWQAAVESIARSLALCKSGTPSDGFYLAMAHWHLGNKEEARQFYDEAVQLLNKKSPKDEEVRRLQEEAADLLRRSEETSK